MNISWVVSSTYQVDPLIEIESLKNVGPIWGSWHTWRNCGTDNVICHDRSKCKELLDRNFQTMCNLHMPMEHYQFLGRPEGIKLYKGDYAQQLDGIEDIVAMHLASQQNDLILMLGFNLFLPTDVQDRFDTHKIRNRHGLIRGAIQSTPQVQWVCLDHEKDLDKAYQNLPNLSKDTLSNVFNML